MDEFKVMELPEFVGGTDPEAYLEWQRKIERMFNFKDIDDEKRCKYAILKLGRGASLWFEGLKSKRIRDGKEKITSWESLKRKLRKRYVPTTHRITTYCKIGDVFGFKIGLDLDQDLALPSILDPPPYFPFPWFSNFKQSLQRISKSEYG